MTRAILSERFAMRWITLIATGLWLVAMMILIGQARAQPAPSCGPANAGQQACMGGSVCRCQSMPGGLMLREPGGYRWNCDLLLGACSGAWMSAIPPQGSAALDDTRPIGAADIRRVQQALTALGLNPGPVDGVDGPRTQAAVSAYQRQAGLPVTGRITRSLVQRLQ
ncbi:MAG: peptidoglycan-binding protein [Alphaproteobacteria bacterium]|nr:peptidoglycan-binding domain-containing protein [Alphaproteobacteria bacterium]TAD88512.1 MAG: peptidoglycan-binding protein [Alphaproteobacteria bacterium]